MIKNNLLIAIKSFALLVIPFCADSQNTTDKKIHAAVESISYDYFFKHVEYLASDELKGRGLATPEFDMEIGSKLSGR